MEKNDFLRKHKWELVIPFAILILEMLVNQQFLAVFGESNYVALHLLIEILIITASFSIAIQAWLIVPYVLSNRRLFIGALFLALGLLEILHTISYLGMPFFIKNSSTYSATWFYMIGRLTLPVGLLFIYIVNFKKVFPARRWVIYGFSFLYAVIWGIIIYNSSHIMPQLVIDGVGPTTLKKNLQYLAILLQVGLVIYLWKSKKSSGIEKAMMMMGSIYLIFADLMFTSYSSVYDIRNFIGHLLSILSYHYFLKALYHSSVEEPFEMLIKTQVELENSKQSLQYMAYHD